MHKNRVIEKTHLPLLVPAYSGRQIGEILSDQNRWFTGEECHHDPSPQECAEHYSQHLAKQRIPLQNRHLNEK